MTKPEAVIFDLDGTLLDTLVDIGTAANDVLRECGFPTHPMDAYRDFVGDGVAVLFRRAVPPAVLDEATLVRCVEGFYRHYDRRWDETSAPYPGIPQLLSALAAADVPLAVLSNKPHTFTEKCVRRFFSDHAFDPVFGARDGVPRKPDPAGVLEILHALGVAAETCWYVGDTDTDMQTARNAGCVAIGAAWGFRPASQLEASGADRLATQPTDLIPWLSE